MKRIVYMGLGRRGASFISAFRQLGLLGTKLTIAGAYDVDVENARKSAKEVGEDVPIYDDPQRMFDETSPDAVIIASYECAHLENFRAVQPLNIPVQIEKPLESTVEKAAELVKLAKKNTAPVLVGHNMRFAPILGRAKQIVEEGRIGEVHSFRFHNNVHYGHGYFRSWMRLRANTGDIMVEKGCHDLDILHMLMGSKTARIFNSSRRFEFGGDKPSDLHCSDCRESVNCPDSVENIRFNVIGDTTPAESIFSDKRHLCVYAKKIDIHDDDVCLVELENGAHGTYVQTLYTPYSYKSRIYTLVGGLGILEIDLDEYEGDLRIYPRYGSKKEFAHEHFDYRNENHYGGDYFMSRHFYEVLSGTAEPACTVEDGYAAVAAAVSAVRSADENRIVKVASI